MQRAGYAPRTSKKSPFKGEFFLRGRNVLKAKARQRAVKRQRFRFSVYCFSARIFFGFWGKNSKKLSNIIVLNMRTKINHLRTKMNQYAYKNEPICVQK